MLENLHIYIHRGPEKPPVAWTPFGQLSPPHTHAHMCTYMHTQHCCYIPFSVHVSGILLHRVKTVTQRGTVTKLKLRRELQSLNLTRLSSIFAAEESRVLFWAPTLIRGEWPYWEMFFQPKKKPLQKPCPLSTSIHGLCLPSSGQREDNSYHWANLQTESETLEFGKLVAAPW